LDASTWADLAGGAASAAQVLAIIVGGVWAYFKFLRGRTFAKRAELSVAPSFLNLGKQSALKVAASLKNAGLSKVPLRTQAVFVYGIYAAPTADDPIATREQLVGKPKKIFAAHKWVEAQETITDEILIVLPNSDPSSQPQGLALRVECRVYEERRKPGGLKWTASALVQKPKPRQGLLRRWTG
jgi:hypothetical protein